MTVLGGNSFIFFFFIAWITTACISFANASSAQFFRSKLGVQRSTFYSENRRLKVEVESDQIIHFEYSDHSHAAPPDEAIYVTPMIHEKEFGGPSFYLRDGNRIETANVRLTVTYPSLCVRTYDLNFQADLGEVCSEDLDRPTKKIIIHPNNFQNIYGIGNYFYDSRSADGDWQGRDWISAEQGNARYGFLGGAPSMSQFPILYALGEGLKNFALFIDTPYRMSWNFRDANRWVGETWGDRIRIFLITGPNLPSLRKQFMTLVGKPLVPPKDVFGLWISKFGYNSWKELRAELDSLRKNLFPVDGFALDLQWFGGTFSDPLIARMGTLSFDLEKFPNPIDEISRLKAEGHVQLMTIEESYVDERIEEFLSLKGSDRESCYLAKVFEEGCEPVRFGNVSQPMWWGRGGMIDWTNPKASEFWHSKKRMNLARMGILHHWTDLGEPEMYNPAAYYYGIEPGKNRHGDVHNLYNFKWLESIHNGYQNQSHQKDLMKALNLSSAPRYFAMSRSGAPGIQRFGAGMWSGDIGRNVGSLRAHLNTQMHLSLAGLDYYNSDVGGFIETTDGHEPGHNDSELYTQWFANSAMGEIPLRPHAWAYGSQEMSVSPDQKGDRESNLQNLMLRYSLTPYLYSLAHHAYRLGEPIFPPLVYYYQADPNTRKNGNVKMIGKYLLYGVVANFAQKERQVYLPAGKWVNFHNYQWYESLGEETPPIQLFMDREGKKSVFTLPLFMKAGSIIPKMPVSSKTLNVFGDQSDHIKNVDLELDVVPDAQTSEFELIEDDGVSLDYRLGIYRSTRISQQQKMSNTLKISSLQIDKAIGEFPGAPIERHHKINFLIEHEDVVDVSIDGTIMKKCDANENSIPHLKEKGCWVNLEKNRIQVHTLNLRSNLAHTIQVTSK